MQCAPSRQKGAGAKDTDQPQKLGECWFDHWPRSDLPGLNCQANIKHRMAVRADAWLTGKIPADPLLEAFHQGTFATFAIFKQLCLATGTKHINGFGRSFLIWFSHICTD